MKNNLKKFLPYIISFLIILLAFIIYYNFPKQEIGENEAVLIISFGETKRAFAGETIERMNVLDALVVSSKAGNFDFEFDFINNNLKRIDQFEEDGKKWNFYFNRKIVEDSPDKIFINPGDRIELKLE